jgi:hypothetical protein
VVQKRSSPVFSILLALLAVVSAAAAIFYWTQNTDFLAFGSGFGIHKKHAAIFAVLTLIFLAGAVLARPRPAIS